MAVVLEIFVERMPPRGWDGDSRDEHFSTLYAACYEPLVDYCARLLRDRTAAADVAQAALARAWEAFDRYSPSRPFWPWVVTVARRMCIDEFRRSERVGTRTAALAALVENRWQSPEDATERAEECRLASAALKTLNPGFQRVVILRELDGWSYDQIASYEGTTVASVRCRLNRARTALRDAYLRMAGGVAAIFELGWLARARRRLVRSEPSGSPSLNPMAAERLSDVASILLVAAMSIVSSAEMVDPIAAVTTVAQTPSSEAIPPEVSAQPAADDARAHSKSVLSGLARLGPGRSSDAAEDVSFVSFTPSPSYESDRTIFAVGRPRAGCLVGGACEVLFRSSDGGASWMRVDEMGFVGERILLAPDFPHDNRVFAESRAALLLSTDNGRTFAPITPSGGTVAMSPSFGTDQRILVGGPAPGWEYDGETGVVRPLLLVPPPAGTQLSFGFSGDGRVLVGSNAGTVTVCDGPVCAAPTPVPNMKGTPRFASAGPTVFAWHGRNLARSTDGGATFQEVVVPGGGIVNEVVALTVDRALIATFDDGGGLFQTVDGGATWHQLGITTPLARGARSVRSLPGGTILAAPPEQVGGVLCSHDGGSTWRTRCA